MVNETVRAPYNFVPFSGKVLEYKEELPPHDRIDPALKTGEIHVTMTAETPVFVSDGKKDPHFFRGADGRFQLPGSTIRGMVRANMQILGFGLIRPGEDIEDRQVFYREIAGPKSGVRGQLKVYYHGVLGIKPMKAPSGKTYSIPQNVKGGYLRKVGNVYQIQPVKGTCLRIPRNHPDAAILGDISAQTVRVSYTVTGDRVEHFKAADQVLPGMETGVLLYTGKPVGKPNHLYLFPEPDEAACPEWISKEDEISYAVDWEGRKNSLSNSQFWALPETGEEKPVFYIKYEGHIYFGMSFFPRIGYRFPLKEGLPKLHKEKAKLPDFLDYPHALLGYSYEKRACRSRISFGDFIAQGEPNELPLVRTILGSPKSSYYPGYVSKGNHYNQEKENELGQANFQLRGHKLYWLKDADVAPAPEDKPNVASKLRPLPVGTVFRGVIRYKNLYPHELGLLLWTLRLEDGCCQSVGMGKPYGLGRMKLEIDSLREYNLKALYTPDGFCAGPRIAGKDAVEQYINIYDSFAAKEMNIKNPKKRPSLHSMQGIRAFFYMRSTIRSRDETSYMALEEYKKMRTPLQDVSEIQKQVAEKAAREAEKAASKRNLPMEEQLAQLAEYFNSQKN